MIKLVLPSYEFEESYNSYIKEIIENNEQFELGNAYRENETYNEMLKRVHNRMNGINVSMNDVPSTILFIVNNNEIIGTIDIRNYLNKSYFYKYGHIAYIIKPSCRNQGYATEALKEAMKICKNKFINKLLIVCYKNNIASSKVIQKNNGILELEYKDKDSNKIIQRWWIDIK